METVAQLKNYCRENKIRGYSKLKKVELIALIQNHSCFSSFHNDLFSKQKKKREHKIRCCGKFVKESSFNKHLQTKAHQNYKKKADADSTSTKTKKPKKETTSQEDHRDEFSNILRLHHMTIPQLHEFCRTRGITGYSKLRRKADIIAYIENVLFNRHFDFDSDLFSDTQERRLYTLHEVNTAFKSRLKTYDIQNEHNLMLSKDFLNDVSSLVRGLITKHLKVNFQFLCDYEKGKDEVMIEMEKNLKTENGVILESTDLVAYYRSIIQKLLTEMEEFVARGSGWTLAKIKSLEVRINKYNPLRESSYIDLPKVIKAKKAVINVKKENDNECFKWEILPALYPSDNHVDRVSKYKPYENVLSFEGTQ
ncbi:uncharacterized protein TNIN_106341 [Trichonephila inaurata madagascariensis]|uniref:Rho termination factor N-terminal domain-containing protein n=1 Tax=Trichonephila inaurata madagascariensis TaxID=2747483 RepID=A0A8X6X3Z5_9ARAC|nr:uncharacterized protein TNIN_106341 [Trichonephila inaurata madagascariensis]